MAEDLNLQLLKAQLPNLHRDAQAGDASARRELVRVIGLIEQMEKSGRGFTAPPAAPGQDVSRLKKRELDQHLAGLQDRDEAPPAWMELYDALLDERDEEGKRRWDWRKAMFIAWSCTPKDQRDPKTLGGLARRLGVATSTMREWRYKDPEIERRISELPRLLLMEHVASVYHALATLASTPDPKTFQDRRLFLELTGQYSPKAGVILGGEVQVATVTAAERIAAMQRALEAEEQ